MELFFVSSVILGALQETAKAAPIRGGKGAAALEKKEKKSGGWLQALGINQDTVFADE